MAYESLAGVILAGGKSTRMASQDKGLLLFDGQPMALRVALALEGVADVVFINANRNIELYRELGFEVISDVERHHDKGPLSGLFTCLQRVETSHLLVSPCDTPRISTAAFLALQVASIEKPNQIHYLTGESGFHPLHAILPTNAALLKLDGFLEQKNRNSVMAFYEFFGCASVVWGKGEELLNVNTPDELS
ncbi:molybdopterin-guanine dinucleotide biosynthesis protein MobA [Marinomonas ushuaiensis DSM 15871]|uniref:Molybdenum cofactor guanylyltransferase n=1 Tax=Marinomonas ushuaiensis DSM 15871 TaxID=1122207 RepID=X7E197_9GAMM|nr:molybdenum cofactor guanylyltransferase [Marinomonas ushuaiensis]ETX09849.1 molybdopterin-guanine dinucleotide biosynthesis protein MobA [Marinomonas ushuaiensis DSM 15871]